MGARRITISRQRLTAILKCKEVTHVGFSVRLFLSDPTAINL